MAMFSLWKADQSMLRGVTVKSRMPGRLRLKLSAALASRLSRRLGSDDTAGLPVSTQFNPRTCSVLIQYDPSTHSEKDAFAVVSRLLEVRPAAASTVPTRPQDGMGGVDEALRSVVRGHLALSSDLPGRVRVRHPLIRQNRSARQRLAVGLMNMEGVRRYRLNANVGSVLVGYSPDVVSREMLIESIAELLHVGLTQGAEGEPGQEQSAQPIKLKRAALQLYLSTGTLGIAALAGGWPLLGTLALLSTLLASLHTIGAGVRGLIVQRQPTVDTLDATVLVVALLNRYVFPAAVMVWLLNIGDLLLEATYRDSRERLTEIFGKRVQEAHRWIDGQITDCPLADLHVDDVVAVFSGEQIPVDGVIVEGTGLIDQSALTGEYGPVERVEGEQVLAMTSMLSGRIYVRVLCSGDETNAAKILRIVEQSLGHNVRVQLASERFAQDMVIPTYVMGSAAHLISGPNAMMGVLNAEFGTGIRIAGPLAVLRSVAAAIEHGILVKNGSVLESLHRVDALVFDKTGTLTQDIPAVRRIVSFDPAYDEARLLTYIASAEQYFQHPIAKAILREAEARGLHLVPLQRSEYQVGLGIEVITGNGLLRVGSLRYIEAQGIALAESQRQQFSAAGDSNPRVFAALDDRPLGMIELESNARPEAYQIIKDLRERRGIKEVFLISGDGQEATARVAQQLEIENYAYEVLPQDKVTFVKNLQQRGLRVAMIGDGINDSAALSQADCGISLRGAADAAIDAADIVLMDGQLHHIDLMFQISGNLTDNVRTSFLLVLVPNSIMIVGGLAGVFGLASSVLLNNAFNLAATYNGLRAQSTLRPRAVSEAV